MYAIVQTSNELVPKLAQMVNDRLEAILDALPAHIAWLDSQGCIVAVNRAWREFCGASLLHGPGHGIGLNYVEICESVLGDGGKDARLIAEGIRSVLLETKKLFSIEYAFHSPIRQQWFELTVTPVTGDRPNGVVVMHADVTAKRLAIEGLHASDLRFRQLAENIHDVFYLHDMGCKNMLYVSPAFEGIWGRSCEALYAHPEFWTGSIHPDDWTATHAQYQRTLPAGTFELEYRIVRPDGAIRWIESRGFAVRDATGQVARVAGIARDITQRRQAALALDESERRFSSLLRNVELAAVMLDSDARITYCNPYLLALTGWQQEEVAGLNWFELFVPDEVATMHEFFESLIRNRPETWHHENAISTRSGERRLVRWNNSVLRSPGGEVIGTASIGVDVTDQRLAEARVKRLNRVYAMISGINSLQVRVLDRQDLFREACRIAVEAGGFCMSWIGIVDHSQKKIALVASVGADAALANTINEGLTLSDIVTPDKTVAARVIRGKKAVVFNDLQGNSKFGFGKKHAAAGVRSIAMLPLVIAGEAEGVFALCANQPDFFHDEELKLLTELVGDVAFGIDYIDKRQRLDYLAYYDALTGLANHSLFLERVAQFIRSAASGGHKLALFLIDVERFKNINDSLGRSAGDMLLRQIAEWLTRQVGDANLVARAGADHFMIVRPVVALDEDLDALIEQRRATFMNHAFRIADSMVRIGFKAGIAVFPQDGVDADTLFRNAEAALKKAKSRGERYLFYKQKMTTAMAGKLTLENQLRQALDKGEFILHYQPKIDLASGKMTSAEALLRWNDPGTGLVLPGHFIPTLEETGLIYDVGRWALRQAVADYLRWRAAGRPAVRIAVNVSPLQLRNRGFVAEVEEVLGIDAGAAEGLELEITESLIMEDVKHSIDSLRAIRAKGVRIAIDDFGTGFSSLSYLARLPVDSLKIDRSFIIDMTVSPQGLALVSTIIDLAHALKLKVVAEGVETEEQSRLLLLLNCDEMQGFLFSKPLPANVFEASYLTLD